MSHRSFWTISLLSSALTAGCLGNANTENQGTTITSSSSEPSLDPTMIPQFVDPLPILPRFAPNRRTDSKTGAQTDNITVTIAQFKEQILPNKFPSTTVYGYSGPARDARSGRTMNIQNAPGPTFEMTPGIPINVTWVNSLTKAHQFPMDPTLHWANPENLPAPTPPFPAFPPSFRAAQAPIPTVTHLHGGESPGKFDGHPEAWFTQNGLQGQKFVTATYTYGNRQPSTTLWYHDHSLGLTRLNMNSGLAGMYIIRDPNNSFDGLNAKAPPSLPRGAQEIPLIIQDRSFNKDGSLFFTTEGNNPDVHPYWDPEFFGNTIIVNGK